MIRLANPDERELIYNFHIPIHLETSVENDEEYKLQIDDIPNDYPALVSDVVFKSYTFFLYYETKQDENCVQQEQLQLAGICGISNQFLQIDSYNNSSDTFAPNCLYLCALSVAKNFRKRGIGRKLLIAAILHAKKQVKVERIQLVTLQKKMDDAVRLYTQAGFKIIKLRQIATFEVLTMQLELNENSILTEFLNKSV